MFAAWGSPNARPYRGLPPTGCASDSARLSAQAEKSLADEAGGPLAQILTIPAGSDGGDGSEDDPLADMKRDIAKARGKAAFVETTAAGWDQGRSGAPQRDWQATRLGPNMPAAMVELARDSFARTLAACGCSPALFDDSDGTSKREALRQWHMGTVQPLARMLEAELAAKLEAPIRLAFDSYPLDLAGRAQAFQKLVAGGMEIDRALAVTGLLGEE